MSEPSFVARRHADAGKSRVLRKRLCLSPRSASSSVRTPMPA